MIKIILIVTLFTTQIYGSVFGNRADINSFANNANFQDINQMILNAQKVPIQRVSVKRVPVELELLKADINNLIDFGYSQVKAHVNAAIDSAYHQVSAVDQMLYAQLNIECGNTNYVTCGFDKLMENVCRGSSDVNIMRNYLPTDDILSGSLISSLDPVFCTKMTKDVREYCSWRFNISPEFDYSATMNEFRKTLGDSIYTNDVYMYVVITNLCPKHLDANYVECLVGVFKKQVCPYVLSNYIDLITSHNALNEFSFQKRLLNDAKQYCL